MRKSGILMHISSLPSKYGIGKLGKEAYEFIDFLKKSGQSLWQVLPINPTSYGDSPYQSFSSFAGNPYFIDFDKLIEDELIDEEDTKNLRLLNENRVDYAKIFEFTFPLLDKAYNNFKANSEEEYLNFLEDNSDWLNDYALFMAIKFENDGLPWYEWEDGIKFREKNAISEYEEKLKYETDRWKFIQYIFFKQWCELKIYANENNIKIIGDIPIYCAYDSVDVWTDYKSFLLDEDRTPISVAGCPPDYFAQDGQLWGNPLYNWEYMKQNNYAWWVKRIGKSTKLYDVLRIDHFRGFDSFFSIPFGSVNAKNGEWMEGPGIELFEIVKKELNNPEIIAEDLGSITKSVEDLLHNTLYPGMKVLVFAFSAGANSSYLPHKYDKNCIVYTGTHDNEPLASWVNSQPEADIEYCMAYLNSSKEDLVDNLIRACISSVANVAIIPMQDYLKLGEGSRMNVPSTLGGNWEWRLHKGALNDEISKKILYLSELYGRI